MAVRGVLKAGGCHWDAEARAWWIGDDAAAQRLATEAATAPAEAAPPKRITRCVVCGSGLDAYQQRRGFRRCLGCCDGGGNAHGGQSYYDRNGRFVLGDDD